jgi:glycogen debranching enzyme
VEIQALWHNALRLMARWAELLGEDPSEFRRRADQARDSFNARYWFENGGHLYDVVDGENGDDASLRPNQIFAVSLPHPILAEARWRPVVDAVTRRLVTPYGVRTLDPSHPDYKPRYEGDLRARDAAYHQGLVWAWLIGPYLDAHRRAYPEDEESSSRLAKLGEHLVEAGVGSVSEIFDAEAPHAARGCVAQAWSVAELLRSFLAAENGADSALRGLPTR